MFSIYLHYVAEKEKNGQHPDCDSRHVNLLEENVDFMKKKARNHYN